MIIAVPIGQPASKIECSLCFEGALRKEKHSNVKFDEF